MLERRENCFKVLLGYLNFLNNLPSAAVFLNKKYIFSSSLFLNELKFHFSFLILHSYIAIYNKLQRLAKAHFVADRQ